MHYFARLFFRLCFLCIGLFCGLAHAALWGPSNYQECIDDVVKNAKVQSAVKLGEDNCFDKFVQPQFDKRVRLAAKNTYRLATPEEINLVKCKRMVYGDLAYATCTIPGRTTKIYSMKMLADFADGSTKEVELKNTIIRDPSTNTFSWNDEVTLNNPTSEPKIIKLKKHSLQIKKNY